MVHKNVLKTTHLIVISQNNNFHYNQVSLTHKKNIWKRIT
jgi:hypothetical protein